jgi:PAS domain-containing protein
MNLEDIYRLLRNNHAEAVGIVDTLPTPLLVLDRDLRVVNGSRAFFGTFQVSRDETIGQFIYDLGNHQWDIPELRLLLEEVIPRSATVTGFEVTHKFPGLGERTMLVSAQRVFHPDNTATTLLVSIEDATERRRIDAERDMLESELRHRMKNSLAVIHALAAQTAVEGRSAA